MSEQADLIVIATPTGNADLPGPTTLPNIASVDNTGRGHEIPARRVETTFHAVTLLKGKLADSSTSFKLMHLKLSNPADGGGRGAPQLMDFDPTSGAQYLMFLKLRTDGSYEPFSQTDPIDSIEKLAQLARPNE
jgi:hypothetical protein